MIHRNPKLLAPPARSALLCALPARAALLRAPRPAALPSALLASTLVLALLAACGQPMPEGLRPALPGTGPKVNFDLTRRPLPEIPLPNDLATRVDPTTPTNLRLNSSVIAPTVWEQKVRRGLDELDGWGTLAPITVSFDAPLDTENIIKRHWFDRFDPSDDTILVVDVSPSSPDFCKSMPLDLGEGHSPLLLDDPNYYSDEPHPGMRQLPFEEAEEDTNHNGVLDPGEDTDMDGVLDHPNTRSATDNSVITFYERETNTLIAKPVIPLREKTTYAVVLTKYLKGADGQPVRSPFASVNHIVQTRALTPLEGCLPKLKLSLDDVTFTWSFTTQSVTHDFVAVRDGLYGLGPLARLSSEFPATLDLMDVAPAGSKNMKVVPSDKFATLARDLFALLGAGGTAARDQLFLKGLEFIDFHALGTIDSPQFFPRFEADGKTQLPLTDQVWRLDPESGAAFTRHEGVNFWLTVPKDRGGKPAPVAIFIHGHGGSKFDSMLFSGVLARYGIATLGIDAPSHGIGIDAVLMALVRSEFNKYGLSNMADALLAGRALDQNGDGKLDSGADYWTAYSFHTRDIVRQTAVDIMQAVRTLRSFDGKRTWKYDAKGTGKPDLAGDLDGDGVVDVGGDAPIYLVGGSLGGIISSYVAGLEPQVSATVAIIGGGVLSEIGSRSSLGGVRNALVLRMMAPLFLAHDGALWQALPDLNDYREVKVGPLPAGGLVPGKIAVLKNLDTGEWRCGRVQPNGHLRVAVGSDKGNRLQLALYDQELASKAPEGCIPLSGVTPTKVYDTFSEAFTYAGVKTAAGATLTALGDGFGLRRGTPELRRLMGLSQVAMERADPANTAPFIHGDRTLTYGTGETVNSRILYLNTIGDPGVPTAGGMMLGRATGLIDYRNIDPRYGKTPMQLLIEDGVVEGVDGTRRYVNGAGEGVLMDVDVLENLSPAGDGFDTPRLSPPLRLVRDNQAPASGKSAILFPLMDPHGVHSFPAPSPDVPFDLGSLLVNQLMRYLATGGQKLDFDPCQLKWSCPWIPAAP
jgi:hypothetical protein